MPDIKMYLFGEPRIEVAGSLIPVRRRKAWALLAYLALAEHHQSRDLLAALLWPDLDQHHARAALRSTLSVMTTSTPGAWLAGDRNLLALHENALWIDVKVFLQLLSRSRAHKHEVPSLCEECFGWLNEAVELYQADFMAGFSVEASGEYDDWQLMQREWLRRELSYALQRLATYSGEQGDFETAVAYAMRWLALDSLHEPAHRLLMRLYAASGQRADALRQYQRCVEILDRELATPPEEETVQLYASLQTDVVITFRPNISAARKAANVLPMLPSLLIGRDQSLIDIKRRLGISADPHPITVIQGWPGVGKSTIVAALAHDHEVSRHFSDGVLWVSLGETPNLLHQLMIWAEALGVSDAGRDRSVEALSAQLTALLRDRQMLLIMDDVWQIKHVAPFRVGGQACVLLITSRLNDVAQALAPTPADIYRLNVLPEPTALELLGRLTPETVAEYPAQARRLVRDLEGLPLAIQVAGRLLHAEARLGWGVSNLLQELRTGVSLLQARAPSDVALREETSPTIAALLRRSTDSLDAEMQQGFALLGLFAPKPATFDLNAMATVWNVSDARSAVRILVNRGLLEPVSGGRFQMHALLVIHARSLLAEMMD